jgi:hypothetical protein
MVRLTRSILLTLRLKGCAVYDSRDKVERLLKGRMLSVHFDQLRFQPMGSMLRILAKLRVACSIALSIFFAS